MFQIFQRLLQKPIIFAQEVLTPPQHIRVHAFGVSMDDCLRQLEQNSNLPDGDLLIKGKPMEVAAWPTGLKSLHHFVVSQTSALWKTDVSTQGYIAGHVIEPIDVAIAGDAYKFFGSLHISKNCPGVYRDNVCTTCGDVSA